MPKYEHTFKTVYGDPSAELAALSAEGWELVAAYRWEEGDRPYTNVYYDLFFKRQAKEAQ